MKKSKQTQVEDSFLMIEPLAVTAVENAGEGDDNPVLKLQLTMATNSINHEYARMEFDDTLDADRKEELLEYMTACRQKYFEARESLVTYDPHAVSEFEADLLQQKFKTLNRFNA
ncbi:MAG: hypothetical protein HY466_01040 [Deltaproteobacteria bacterium]|nr:hypothetical protein [Deltaproteobacteria bacterium]